MYRDAMQRGHDSRGVRKWIDSLPSDRFAEMAAPQDPGVNPEIIPFEIPAESLEKMAKEGTSRGWKLRCDEGPNMGGEDSAPAPLDYFTMGIAF